MVQYQTNNSNSDLQSISDLQTISFDSSCTDSYNSNFTCCERICLFTFFRTSLGMSKYNESSNDKRHECICCNLFAWGCEFKLKCTCCIKEIGCCCFTLSCE